MIAKTTKIKRKHLVKEEKKLLHGQLPQWKRTSILQGYASLPISQHEKKLREIGGVKNQ